MRGIERKRWMMNRDEELLVLVGTRELLLQISLLVDAAARVQAALHIGVKADDGHEGCVKSPVNIGLGNRHAGGTDVFRRRRAEVLKKSVEGRLAVGRIALFNLGIPVVIAGNGEDGRRIVLVGFVELRFVQGALAVEVDNISEVKEERRLQTLRSSIDLVF